MEGLDTRLAAILGVESETDDVHGEIKKRIWSLNDVYSFQTNGQSLDVFYLNDEVGSRIYHSGNLYSSYPCFVGLFLRWEKPDPACQELPVI